MADLLQAIPHLALGLALRPARAAPARDVGARRQHDGARLRHPAARRLHPRPSDDEHRGRRHADRRLRHRRPAPRRASRRRSSSSGRRRPSSSRSCCCASACRTTRPARSTTSLVKRTREVNRRLLGSRVVRPIYLTLWVPNGLIVGCEALFVPFAGERAGYLFAVSAAGMLIGDVVVGRFVPTALRDRLIGPLRFLLAVPYLGFFLVPVPAVCRRAGLRRVGGLLRRASRCRSGSSRTPTARCAARSSGCRAPVSWSARRSARCSAERRRQLSGSGPDGGGAGDGCHGARVARRLARPHPGAAPVASRRAGRGRRHLTAACAPGTCGAGEVSTARPAVRLAPVGREVSTARPAVRLAPARAGRCQTRGSGDEAPPTGDGGRLGAAGRRRAWRAGWRRARSRSWC